MKKIFSIAAGICIITTLNMPAVTAMPSGYMDVPNAGNRNFQPIMQQKFEKEDSLDFINNPEGYKEKREKKDAILDYQEGKTDEIPEFLKPKINIQDNRPGNNNMQFIKDENGQIRIKSNTP